MKDGDDPDFIHDVGHREFIGGNDDYWEKVSALQFDFLVSQGLSKNDVFIDIACGSLRGGIKLIPFLERGNYIGFDKHIELIIYGVSQELGVELYQQKRPRFVVNDAFDFSKLPRNPTFGIAQSLFSHLTAIDIVQCLRNLREACASECRFFATFNLGDKQVDNTSNSHSRMFFRYTRDEMENFGRICGWRSKFLGEWNHPRGQKLIEYHT